MRYFDLSSGRRIAVPETAEDWLSLQPEARLREYLAGDEAATLRYHARMLDLELRWDRWPSGAPA